MPKMDMTDVGGGFEPIPAGVYRAQITGAEDKEVSENTKKPENVGKPYTAWEFTIIDGEYASRKQWCNAMHWGGGRFMMKDILVNSEAFTEEQVDSAEFEFDYDDVIGREVCIRVGVRQYQGEDRNDVKKVLAASEETTEEKNSGSDSRMPV